jgi:hypothetical protein
LKGLPDEGDVIADAIAEITRLRDTMNFTYCAYCGQRYPLDTDGADVAKHIDTCPKHPIADYKAEITRLRAALALAERQAATAHDLLEHMAAPTSEEKTA